MAHWLDDFAFPETWRDLRGQADEDATRAGQLAEQLERELGRKHLLKRAGWRVVAESDGRDDVLLALAEGTAAIAHLTYTSRPPDKPPWPTTTILATPDELDDEFLMRD